MKQRIEEMLGKVNQVESGCVGKIKVKGHR